MRKSGVCGETSAETTKVPVQIIVSLRLGRAALQMVRVREGGGSIRKGKKRCGLCVFLGVKSQVSRQGSPIPSCFDTISETRTSSTCICLGTDLESLVRVGEGVVCWLLWCVM